MATIEKTISKKLTPDGKAQVMLRFIVSRNCMFRCKTPVFISPDLFNLSIGDIIIPKRNKGNINLYNDAVLAKADLDNYISRVSGIIAAGRPDGGKLSKDWVEKLLSMQDDKDIALNTRHLTAMDIESALRKEQKIEDEKRAQIEAKEREASKQKTELATAIDAYLEHQKLCEGRVRHYKVLQGMINRFTMFTRETSIDKNFAMYIDSVSSDILQEFFNYVRNEAKLIAKHKRVFDKIEKIFPFSANPDKPRSIGERGANYISSKKKQLNAVFNWYIKQGKIVSNPLLRVDTEREIYGNPIYITKAERDQIADFDLSEASKNIQEQRDIFIFQCLIGCRVGDLKKLTFANVHDGVLEYVPQKTKDHLHQVKPRVPLCQRALDLIDKYKGVDKNGRLFPFITDQNYNDDIKTVFKLCGITRNVIVRDSVSGQNVLKPINEVASSHMARRTFVGAAYKAVKDPNLIGAMSGHVPGSQAFNRYRQIDDEDLKDVISKIS